jgi:hypothetical protein
VGVDKIETVWFPLPFIPSAYSAEVASGYVGRAPRGGEILGGHFRES